MLSHRPLSIRGRFVVTLAANGAKSLLSFVTGLLLARGLGPNAYGSLFFLLGVAVAIRQLLDLGSSAAFFTFLSQKARSPRFVAYYFGWVVIQLLVPLIAIWLLLPERWVDVIWKGEGRELASLAFVASFLQNGVWPTILQMGESQRATRRVQLIGVGVAFTHLVVVAALWAWSQLGLYLVLGAIILEYLTAAWVAMGGLTFSTATAGDDDPFGKVFREYAAYCLPLIPYGWIGFLYSLADSWLLQHFGGKAAQAYYGVSLQFALMAAVLVSSVQNILWKEVAEAKERGDLQRMAMQYRKVSRIFFFACAMGGGFFMFWAEELLRTFLGGAYAGGGFVLAIMCLYPAQLCMGQIESTMMLATGRVRLMVVIGNWFMLTSIAVSYLLLAPSDALIPALGLGAIGMALKMVVMSWIQVNAMAYMNSSYMGLQHDWRHQLMSLITVVVAGWIASKGGHWLSGQEVATMVAVAIALVVYLALVIASIAAMPWLVDSDRFRFSNVLSARR